MRCLVTQIYSGNGKLFDTILCISSIEHDGLGRYGDPINPNADLQTMARMRRMLVQGGLLYMSFPVGRDCVVWTACRVYGRLRIPLLFRGWTLLGVRGAAEGV